MTTKKLSRESFQEKMKDMTVRECQYVLQRRDLRKVLLTHAAKQIEHTDIRLYPLDA